MSQRFDQSLARIIHDETAPDEITSLIEQNPEKCPFLDIIPYAQCENKEQRLVWNKVNSYATEAAESIRRKFEELGETYRYGKNEGFGPKIKQFLQDNALMYPSFFFRFGDEGQEILREQHWEDRVKEVGQNEGILVFQLPSPLAKFWNKSSYKAGSSDADEKQNPQDKINNTAIEWGTLYQLIMPTVWEMTDKYNNEGQMMFTRVNYFGEHNANDYYYVWTVN